MHHMHSCYYILSSFIMFLVCITNECTAVNTLEQSVFSGKSVSIKYIIIIIIFVVITVLCISNPIHSVEYVIWDYSILTFIKEFEAG